ncbi:uncharacterized protein E0L32_008628 [Thyridium curvatum]|uniref:Uncharacterized protein n=1 Tax=Thyridium curvatum TaxID=1093900 RepID=A0A507AZH1_9PEZI|nr:uncharacterized protein E0L32_008628 [Thyridium curvatum]TPX10409.1 hypothetical protein E0L32_008628 [Thyridium curvatum]
MESYGLPMGGFQLPFQRRLSRLYNDTKKSSDFVKDTVQNEEDPEIKAMHRKLRIQKDRLVTWGLEWSDPSQSAEVLIDSSLSKAGLSEVVGSIMSTIKDILAEAEPLWLSSKRFVGETDAPKSAGDKKMPIVTWDKGRFEDLVRDLTTSIDTLYDLSRTRSSATSQAARSKLYKSGSSMEDLRPFESSRMQTPQHIDPQTLTHLQSMQAEPMTESASTHKLRDIVFMSKQAYSGLTPTGTTRQPYSPLLLEYAPFDPIYSTTGIMPSMTRFEKLSAGLQTEPQRSPGSWTGLPRLLGYFEDMEHSRLGLVYQFPLNFNPVSFENLTQNPLYNLCSLSDLLAKPDFEPKLEAKFRLAYNLANTVFDMHARGITHGNLIDTNISFCNTTGTEPGLSSGEVDIRRPLISAFDLFPDSLLHDPSVGTLVSLYRHPLDPRTAAQSGQTPVVVNADPKVFDLYSLAMLLLSIGLWTNLENLVTHPTSTSIPESVLEQLAIRCGTLYTKAVQTCWTAIDKELAGRVTGDTLLARVQVKASRFLEACCILDGVSGLEERLSDDLGDDSITSRLATSTPQQQGGSSSKDLEAMRQSIEDTFLSASERATPVAETRRPIQTTPISSTPVASPILKEKSPITSAKMRLYTHVSLPKETVDQWNTMLMPQINQALRQFYRKHAESVEISLESIGKTPRDTQPTVLIVCTSVSKVRNILRRKLGDLFDGTTGFALKVCRGQVLRSRNRGIPRSMAKEDQSDAIAANRDFQERPRNGASIGAWIGDRHLPPVSLGGLIMVDDKPYGMTVHHMLDDPEADESTLTEDRPVPVLRSSAASQEIQQLNESLAEWYANLPYDPSCPTSASSSDDDCACEFSDTDTDDYSESAITSEPSESGDEYDGHDEYGEPGDIPGIEPGCGDGYVVTQPALDDVQEGFYPSPENQNEDHLDTFSLGDVYASSGIRRRSDDSGLIHEIDWALFQFHNERLPHENSIPHVPILAQDSSRKGAKGRKAEAQQRTAMYHLAGNEVHPIDVAPTSALPGLEVECIARTSGMQTGLVLPTIVSVKIYGRASPSHTYQVTGTKPLYNPHHTQGRRPMPMGIPGDSGAWLVERANGRLCGHVLAWSERKKVAYICPMDVLLLDIAETLGAAEVRLPGGEAIVKIQDQSREGHVVYEDERHHGLPSPLDRQRVADEGYHEDIEVGDEDEGQKFAQGGQSPPLDVQRSAPCRGTSPIADIDLAREMGKMRLGGSGVPVTS